ncbi:MarR family winged helix-turn-helix transcriptional regulator [Ideonella livida]|uniref:MarR family transcriptional regulator n=1 Tax=Ideonella livida TaxID=2707176 RepID=A0A7C9TPH7_9BURK|nr:MarR family transcriptional regulator [Ideonella livida]NDY93906.1 MarR family transcriptional regulator [Ideonella livida]
MADPARRAAGTGGSPVPSAGPGSAPDAAAWLQLDRQLCFPLYATARLVTRLYQPLLEPLGLTYPQYIVLMILWEQAPCTVGHIGQRALLNTNTLTPLLKRLEQQGLVTRLRRVQDERVVEVHLTPAGQALQARCACVPRQVLAQVGFAADKAAALKGLLVELMDALGPGETA